MKTTLLLIFLIFGISIGNSQNNIKKEKAICVIENISSDYNISNNSNYDLIDGTNIEYNQETGAFKITKTLSHFRKEYSTREIIFNISNIKTDKMYYKVSEILDGKYTVFVQLNALEKAVKIIDTDINEKDTSPTIKTRFMKRLLFNPGSKTLPKKLIMKYVENLKILFGAKKLINVTND